MTLSNAEGVPKLSVRYQRTARLRGQFWGDNFCQSDDFCHLPRSQARVCAYARDGPPHALQPVMTKCNDTFLDADDSLKHCERNEGHEGYCSPEADPCSACSGTGVVEYDTTDSRYEHTTKEMSCPECGDGGFMDDGQYDEGEDDEA
jgi:ribosomal protein S27AE